MERENGVNEVRILGVIASNNAANCVNARGIRQRTRRGTASHKTEWSDERVDLRLLVLNGYKVERAGLGDIPVASLQLSRPPRRDLQSVPDAGRRQDWVFLIFGDG